LDSISKSGAEKAAEIAEKTLRLVQDKVGFMPR